MLYIFLWFVFMSLTVYFYFFYKPVTLGDKLGIAEKDQAKIKHKKYYEYEFPLLGKLDYFNKLSRNVSEHGAHATPAHLGFIAVVLMAVSIIFGILLFRNVSLTIVFSTLLSLGGSRIYAGWLISKQREKISEQLGGALLSLTSSLRAGKTLLDSLKIVSEEMTAPLGTEFGKVFNAVKHGGEDLNAALKKMLVRSGNHLILQKVVLAITITRQTGGNIASALEGVGRILDDENYTRQFTKSYSSHGKLVGISFNAVILIVTFNMNRIMPGSMAGFFLSSFKGQLMLFLCVSAIIAGWIIIFRMLSTVFDV